jgi:hypothetical protein
VSGGTVNTSRNRDHIVGNDTRSRSGNAGSAWVSDGGRLVYLIMSKRATPAVGMIAKKSSAAASGGDVDPPEGADDFGAGLDPVRPTKPAAE